MLVAAAAWVGACKADRNAVVTEHRRRNDVRCSTGASGVWTLQDADKLSWDECDALLEKPPAEPEAAEQTRMRESCSQLTWMQARVDSGCTFVKPAAIDALHLPMNGEGDARMAWRLLTNSAAILGAICVLALMMLLVLFLTRLRGALMAPRLRTLLFALGVGAVTIMAIEVARADRVVKEQLRLTARWTESCAPLQERMAHARQMANDQCLKLGIQDCTSRSDFQNAQKWNLWYLLQKSLQRIETGYACAPPAMASADTRAASTDGRAAGEPTPAAVHKTSPPNGETGQAGQANGDPAQVPPIPILSIPLAPDPGATPPLNSLPGALNGLEQSGREGGINLCQNRLALGIIASAQAPLFLALCELGIALQLGSTKERGSQGALSTDEILRVGNRDGTEEDLKKVAEELDQSKPKKPEDKDAALTELAQAYPNSPEVKERVARRCAETLTAADCRNQAQAYARLQQQLQGSNLCESSNFDQHFFGVIWKQKCRGDQ
ncbi:hypothetical protein [Myxococcus hansupus]|uniref:hypothetical protein n=1 Tax=Pseudomyxococcus hansupus TaxID=1297742 RepID=UPI0011877202|nr:hypothetical protein [Myxococcus hansupus]